MSAAGELVEVMLADGSTLRSELFRPGGVGPHPGVLVLHESFGLNDDIRRIARRFAGSGYAAMSPDLAGLGVPHDVKTYDGAGHSFFSRYDGYQAWLARLPTPLAVGYDDDAAEHGWRRMLAFFEEHVRRPRG